MFTLFLFYRESLTFQIIAFDGGFPQPKSDTTNVTIYLQDSPDTPPQFSTDSINASIFENSPLLTYITTVQAVDPDEGEAGEFSFRIDYNHYASLFVINSTTGNSRGISLVLKVFCGKLTRVRHTRVI